MKNKRKKNILIISLMIALVAIGAIAYSIALVFAAETQGTYSGIKIYFESVNINATVSGQYRVAGGTYNSLGSAKIDPASEASTNTSLSSANDIILDIDNTYAEFKFKFTNDSTVNLINLSLDDGAKKTNINTKYGYSKTDINSATNYASALNGGNPLQIGVGETLYVFVYVEIANLADNAIYESNGTNYLSWQLTAEELAE